MMSPVVAVVQVAVAATMVLVVLAQQVKVAMVALACSRLAGTPVVVEVAQADWV
jgi:hypothetical protein